MKSPVPLNSKHRYYGATDMMAVVSVMGLVLLYGLIISLYTMLIRFTTFHTNSEDSVKQAALQVAQSLSNLYVDDQIFGRVGIADREPTDENPTRITSLNRLFATNRLDTVAAKRLGLPAMWVHADADLKRLQHIQAQLRKLMLTEADANVSLSGPKASSNWFARVYKRLSTVYGSDEQLIDLRIRLGTLKPSRFNSGQPGFVTAIDGEILAANGEYKTNTPISSSDNERINFYQLASKPQLCNENDFSECSPSMTPSVVLVEASFKSSSHTRNIDIVKTRTACAIAGGLKHGSRPSVFMISFPHGAPASITSLRDLMTSGDQRGIWLQASNGDVPGAGHLTPPISGQKDMRTGEAVQQSFYHWLRSLGPGLQIDQIGLLVDRPWNKLAVKHAAPSITESTPLLPKKSEALNNSALTKETNARTFALINKSGPSGAGQSALKAAFQGDARRSSIPSSALPLQVDAAGNCRIPGSTGLDTTLLNEFLTGLYETNMAATESQTTAKSIIARLESASEQIGSNRFMITEELNSLRSKLEKEKHAHPPANQDRISSLQKGVTELDATLAAQDLKVRQYEAIIERARLVIANAKKAARDTYYVATHMDWLARNGLTRGSGRPPSFLLSEETLFTPIRKPLVEEELFRPEPVLWATKQLSVVEQLPPDMSMQVAPASTSAAAQSSALPTPKFVLLDSRLLTGQTGRILVLPQSPFSDSGVPAGQSVFYCSDSWRTGKTPPVAWSALIRDVVGNMHAGGLPLDSKQSKWFSSDELQTSRAPGLAVEVQVRAPTPVLDSLPQGASLMDPDTELHEQASQIPPTPAGML